ncbi:hypothetical protein OXA63_25905 [Klebsiella pneumoniae]
MIEHADSVDDLKQRLREIIDEELLKVSEVFEPELENDEESMIDITIDF